MTLEEKINIDLKEAMKSKDQAALRTIRSIKAAIILIKTDGSGDQINEDREIKLLQKLLKQRKESLTIFEQQGRTDLATTEIEEIEVIEKYLPKALSIEEVTYKIKEIIAQTGAVGMKDMGKVMSIASKNLAGSADGTTISQVVKTLLAGI
jgi:uncharacterized protein